MNESDGVPHADIYDDQDDYDNQDFVRICQKSDGHDEEDGTEKAHQQQLQLND